MKKIVHSMIGVAFLALSLTSCGSKKAKPEAEAVELKSKEAASVDTPEAALLDEAQKYYSQGLFTVAKDSFESLKNSYPTSPLAEYAEVKIADCYFHSGDYKTAALNYENFLKSHPASQTAPYALMMTGRSYHLSQRGLGRDTGPLEKALDFYDKALQKYPDSIYAASIPALRNEVVQDIADYHKLVRDYYKKRHNEKAADAREQVIETKWRPLLKEIPAPKTQLASNGTVPVGVKLESVAPVQELPPIPAPAAVGKSGTKTKDNSKTASLEPATPSTSHGNIVQVSCSTDGGKKVIIELTNEISDAGFLDAHRSLSPSNGKLALALPQMTAREAQQDCFGSKDLEISKSAALTLKSDVGAQVLTLMSPPRLLIVLQ